MTNRTDEIADLREHVEMLTELTSRLLLTLLQSKALSLNDAREMVDASVTKLLPIRPTGIDARWQILTDALQMP